MKVLTDDNGYVVDVGGADPQTQALIEKALAEGKPVVAGDKPPADLPDGAVFLRISE